MQGQLVSAFCMKDGGSESDDKTEWTSQIITRYDDEGTRNNG